MEQVLAASPGVLAAFKLANLLSFYRNTLAGIVGGDAVWLYKFNSVELYE